MFTDRPADPDWCSRDDDLFPGSSRRAKVGSNGGFARHKPRLLRGHIVK